MPIDLKEVDRTLVIRAADGDPSEDHPHEIGEALAAWIKRIR